jgi:hypothetical protein
MHLQSRSRGHQPEGERVGLRKGTRSHTRASRTSAPSGRGEPRPDGAGRPLRTAARPCRSSAAQSSRILTDQERRQLRAIVDDLKPAHTHFVDLIEPLPPIVPDHWELGLSDLGETTDLH